MLPATAPAPKPTLDRVGDTGSKYDSFRGSSRQCGSAWLLSGIMLRFGAIT